MADDVKHVWELMEKISIAMLTTWTGEKLRSRPLDARVRRNENAIYALIDERHCKDDEIRKYPKVMFAFADNSAMKYVSLAGDAAVTNDRAKIKQLWSPFAKAWWDSSDDPDIRLLTVTPDQAEIWDSPNKLVATAVMLTAAVTGAKPAVSEHGAVRM